MAFSTPTSAPTTMLIRARRDRRRGGLAVGLQRSRLVRPAPAVHQRRSLRWPRPRKPVQHYLETVNRDDITAALAGLCGYFTDVARQPSDPRPSDRASLPTSAGPIDAELAPRDATQREPPRRSISRRYELSLAAPISRCRSRAAFRTSCCTRIDRQPGMFQLGLAARRGSLSLHNTMSTNR